MGTRFPHGISANTNDASTTGEVRATTINVTGSATIETLVVSSACTLASATANHMEVASGATIEHLTVSSGTTLDSLVCNSAATFKGSLTATSATVNHMAVSSGCTIDHLHVSSGATFDDDIKVTGVVILGDKKLDAASKTVTITATSPNILCCGPGSSASTIQLPGDSISDGLMFLIKHSGTNSKTLAIKNSTSTPLCTISSAQAALCFCSTFGWFCHQMAAS